MHWISLILAFVLVTVSTYVLWDMWHTERSAFASYDLVRYRPNVENDEPATLDEIKKINKDARAWLTLYGTHIDYPVTQGKNNLEYVNKDVYGKRSPTGSIYEATESDPHFKDPYTLFYGHHVNSGSMFGDITNYLKKAYFYGHKKGILITDNKVYDIEVFAVMSTHAYDAMVYHPNRVKDVKPELLPYIKSKSSIYDKSVHDINKIIAFSTCEDETTNGRTVLFAKLSEHEGEYVPYEIQDTGPPLNLLRGETYWAFLNLVCLIFTGYNFFPLHVIKSKLRRKKEMKERNESFKDDEQYKALPEKSTLFYEVKKFSHKSLYGIIAELLVFLIALITFLYTEDLRYPIQMIDIWTPLMILFLLISWLFDRYLVRYKLYDKDNDEEEDNDNGENSEGEDEDSSDDDEADSSDSQS